MCAGGEIADTQGNNQCEANCAVTGEVLNAAGNSCLSDCASAGEMADIDGNNQCETTTSITSKKFHIQQICQLSIIYN